MKKYISICAISVFALASAFAEVDVRVEITTDIVKMDTTEPENADYFTSNDYDDFKVEFNLEKEKFGAKAVLTTDANMENLSFENISAWGKFGDIAKIQFGDFENREGMNLTSLIDEYELGVLQFNTVEAGDSRVFKTLAEGNRLENFVVDFYLDAFSPIPATVQIMADAINFKEQIKYGGRVRTDILDFAKINVTAVYFDNDVNYRTTIGTFLELPNLTADLKVLTGYTIRVWEVKDIIVGDKHGLDHGIDLRAQMPIKLPFANLILATQNNFSIYGDAGDGKHYMALSNEVKARMPFKGGIAAIASLKSHYYNNPGEIVPETAPETFYDFGVYAGLTYNFGKDITLEAGVEVMSIANKHANVMVGVPFNFTFWF